MTLEEKLKVLGTATWTHTQLNEIGQAALKKIELQRRIMVALTRFINECGMEDVASAEAELAALEKEEQQQ